ncbi:MAG TPA: aryl-sulfate sulfotransferase [Gemmataceae bacterium]|jgi:hypothetical protein|nr:aryl-sulfate sulfotransferase [Gemmataceae bacterium]
MHLRSAGLVRTGSAVILGLGLCLVALISSKGAVEAREDVVPPAKGKNDPPPAKAQPSKQSAAKLGLSVNDLKAFQGYTLFAPMNSSTTYLIDMQGRVVRTWQSDCSPALCATLLENGHLLRPGGVGQDAAIFGGGPGVGGRVQEFTWDGDVIWDFRFANSKQLPHHDITRLPNGNILMIVWDKKSAKEALAAGRRPEMVGDSHLLPDSLIEVKPTGKTTGEIVWEWHLWDHLVQDFEKTRANYGNVAEHPELVNINYGEDALAPIMATKAGADKLKSIGYVGANAGRPQRVNPDWTHFNGVSYNPDLDQIIVSVHSFSEFWILDHSTTRAEAAGHSGGRSGKGGDLLYRWGNPRVYRGGSKADQRLFAQHNAHWIPRGLPGAGHLLVFNNGSGRADGTYSSVDELELPVDVEGHYYRKPGAPYGPAAALWSYTAPKKSDFYSFFISGAQRLPNGNTLICSGANGIVFEVTPEKETVWKYTNPVKGGMASPGGFSAPAPPGQLMSAVTQDILGFSAEQKSRLAELQKDVNGKLDQLLKDEQKKQLTARPAGAGPVGGSSQIGQMMTTSEQNRLKLTSEQKKELGGIQKDVDGRLAKILSEEQNKQIKNARGGFGRGGPGGPPGPMAFQPGGPGGRGGPGGPPQPGQLLPSFAQDTLKLTKDQKKQLEEFQKEVNGKLEKLLTDDQKKQLKQPAGGAGGRPAGDFAQPGQIMGLTAQIRLKLTAEQRKQLQELQKEADSKLDKLLAEQQKKQFKEMRANFGRGGPGGFGPPGGGGPGGPGGPPGGGPSGSSLFRAYRYATNYPALAGKDLTPGKTVEELQVKDEKTPASKPAPAAATKTSKTP